MSGTTTIDVPLSPSGARDGALRGEGRSELALVVAWWKTEPQRVGEVLRMPRVGEELVFGRALEGDEGPARRITLVRERPAGNAPGAALRDPFLSRTQLKIRPGAETLAVENVGRRKMLIDGAVTASGHVEPGSVLEIDGQLLLYCTRRPQLPSIAGARDLRDIEFTFGEADAQGIVGESSAAWHLRARLAFSAPRPAHVLLLGESGTGKELVAQALHALSPRARKRLVARNAATFPAGLIDAELFGNAASYPNAGMPERAGVVGEADGSTLFLDEIGELPSELQAHLLRFLDDGGEYQRLGDARRRSADVRVVAATNRPIGELKHDLAARLPLRLELPGLNERKEDVPLLARHLLRRFAANDAELGARFFDGWNGNTKTTTAQPRLSAALVRALLQRTYTTHVRELSSLLWQAMLASPGDVVEAAPGAGDESEAPALAERREVPADELRAALDRNAWVQERVWRELDLPNRFVLQRLIKKFGIVRGE